MFDRENAVGFLLLEFCAVVAGVLIYSIQTGTQFRFTGPSWLGWALMPSSLAPTQPPAGLAGICHSHHATHRGAQPQSQQLGSNS